MKQETLKGLFFVAGYTWAHSIDDSSSNRGYTIQNSYDPGAERGDSSFDIRNRFTFAATYQPAALSRLRGRVGLTPCETGGVTLHYDDDRIEIHKLVVGPVDNNVFVLRDKQTGDAVLLDAANEHDKLLPLAERLGVRRILETHGHWDHIQAIPQMREAGYEVAVTAEDAPRLQEVGYDVFLEPETVIEVGRTRLHTILTPGHTAGSMCFLVEGAPILLSGDPLFPGGPGATSFPGGDFPAIIRSIDEKLFTLPAATMVLPGHGLDTSIGTERPHLQEWVDRGW